MYYVGLDCGIMFSKAVVFSGGDLVAYSIVPSRSDYRLAVFQALEEALNKSNITRQEVTSMVITGFGAAAAALPYSYMSDISCVAKGVAYLFPRAQTVIEIGAQASKVIRIGDNGRLLNFALGDRCAGGSGRFLQVMTKVLAINFEDISRLALNAKKRVKFSTSCAVFTETEAISRIAEGASPAEILAGVHEAMASKIVSLLQRVNLAEDCVICGGGAKDVAVVKMIEEKLKVNLFVPSEPIICGAIGAAIIAQETKAQGAGGEKCN